MKGINDRHERQGRANAGRHGPILHRLAQLSALEQGNSKQTCIAAREGPSHSNPYSPHTLPQAIELDDFPKFLLWLTEQDAILAGVVATRQEEFELVFQKVGGMAKAKEAKGAGRTASYSSHPRRTQIKSEMAQKK